MRESDHAPHRLQLNELVLGTGKGRTAKNSVLCLLISGEITERLVGLTANLSCAGLASAGARAAPPPSAPNPPAPAPPVPPPNMPIICCICSCDGIGSPAAPPRAANGLAAAPPAPAAGGAPGAAPKAPGCASSREQGQCR